MVEYKDDYYRMNRDWTNKWGDSGFLVRLPTLADNFRGEGWKEKSDAF